MIKHGEVMLSVSDMHAYYGKSHILHGVNMQVRAGEIVALLGRNGAGRSTTCKAIMGEVPPSGSVLFKGAWFRSDNPSFSDVTKFWIMLNADF